MKIVINACFGGFGLSYVAVMRYAELKGIKLYAYLDDITKRIYGDRAVIGNDELIHHYATKKLKDGYNDAELNDNYFSDYDIPRNDPVLIQVVEEMGEKASGWSAQLKIVEIPDGLDWEIDEYDGIESIHEKHRSWG
jgi:hypothetical protein